VAFGARVHGTPSTASSRPEMPILVSGLTRNSLRQQRAIWPAATSSSRWAESTSEEEPGDDLAIALQKIAERDGQKQ